MTARDSPGQVDPAATTQAAATWTAKRRLDASPVTRPAPHQASRSRRARWGRRELALLVLLGCVGLFALIRWLALQPFVDAKWRVEADDVVRLMYSPLPQLKGLNGGHLVRISGSEGRTVEIDADLLHHSPRWSVDDATRRHQLDTQQRLSSLLGQGAVRLHFDDGRQAVLEPGARGIAGIGALFWLLCAVALALTLVSAVVLVLHPHWRNVPYALIALCQGANLLTLGVETLPGLGLPQAFAQHGLLARTAFDLCSAAAMVHLATLQPLRLPLRHWIALASWSACAALVALAARQTLPLAWWWTQACMLACGVLTLLLMTWSYRLEPNPFALLMRRLAAAACVTLALLSAAVAVASWHGNLAQSDASLSSVIWYLFLSSLILLLPMFSRVQPLMRELAMLAGTSTVATSLDLLFAAAFSLGTFASLSLSVFLALAVYAGTRRWLLRPMSGQHVPGAERMFERLYRVLREVEARPRDSAELLTRLLRDLFEPLQVQTLDRPSARSRVLGDGSALLVPLPTIDADRERGTDGSIVLRFAERGKRMFSRDDARLTDRVVEQLRRAVAYDKAVERGRSEERARIAQDLHDDIGARLLTLMYKAQTPEMEDYIRHTLKDLKTLTRGLASSDQRLSHATAEWKADIAQRLGAAQIELSWTFNFDHDIVLGVVQWSALTRVLRELVSNAIQHSCATHLDVTASLEDGRLRLSLADDGIGRDPQAWSHGLGLGGVRKRVKLLGGDVQWRENGRAGIVCTVLIPDLNPRH
jgi:signal transduction histidine kinase